MNQWKDKRVALTGRLASMDRRAAASLLSDLGAVPVARVGPRTDMLVIGGDGWPLRRSGRPTKNLQRAGTLQHRGAAIEIVSEATFLRRLELNEHAETVQRLYTVEQVSSVVKVSGLRLRRWIDAGLLRPHEVRSGVALFRFSQVASIRDLSKLIAGGCSPQTIFRSLRGLGRFSDFDAAISDLQRFGKSLVTRTADGTLVDGHGQRLFDFTDDGVPAILPADRPQQRLDPEDAFNRAAALEASQPDAAIAAYEEWLERFGPDATVCFNLANLFAAEHLERSLDFYRDSLRLDSGNPHVWNNYALALAELQRYDEAAAALERAVACDPDYADAYYNLADVLDLSGRSGRAKLLWMKYLRLEPEGEHADFARRRCGERLAPAE